MIGVLRRLQRDPLGLFLSAHREFGDVVSLPLPFLSLYLVSHPDGVKHVLADNAKAYKKSHMYDKLKLLLGNGLLTSEGELWHRQRRLAQPAFHRNQIAAHVPVMVAATARMLARWDAFAAAGTPVDVAAEMSRLTLGIVGETLFAQDLSGDAEEAGRAVTFTINDMDRRMSAIVDVPLWVPSRTNLRFRSARATLERLVTRLIDERRRHPADRPDLLSRMMEAKDDETGRGMSDRQLRDEMMTFLMAGHETTANALNWTWVLLARHPAVRERLEAEVDAVLGDRPPALEDLPRLESCRRVIFESLRLYPPAWVVERTALADDVVHGVPVRAGCWIATSPWVTHRHPDFWPDPELFDPDRFSPEATAARHEFAYYPFGAGPRHCIGRGFALMELQLVLPMVLRRFRIELDPSHPIGLDPKVTLRPTRGVLASLARRGLPP